MPNGRVHDIITAITTPILIGGVYYLSNKNTEITTVIITAYLFSSLMFNGDLDTNSRPYNRWWLLKMIWIPYQLMFSHRSIFTHGIIIGTVVRLVYLLIIPVLILYFNGNLSAIVNLLTSNQNMVLYTIAGLELGSAVHTISDRVL